MALVDYEIKDLCLDFNVVTPFNEEMINPASLDIRIGDRLLYPSPFTREWNTVNLDGFSKNVPYLIPHLGFVLVDSLETFNLPDHITAQFKLKSSRAREGFSHPIAGFCDPGWHDSKLTMELFNVHPWPIELYPGKRIGQIVFDWCNPPKRSYAETGRYNGDRTVSASKG